MIRRAARRPRRKPKFRQEVCKPCWELKYCPYGPVLEQFPFSTESPKHLTQTRRRYREVLSLFEEGKVKGEEDILSLVDVLDHCYPPRWERMSKYDTRELACNVFGHICPVFFVAESFTETKEGRRHSRYIPRDIMVKVVRRDGQICQRCLKPVRDDEIEFDHLIPHSKGGPVSAENLRVVCRRCNRGRRDSLRELLDERSEETPL